MNKRTLAKRIAAVAAILVMVAPVSMVFGQEKKKRESVRGKGRITVSDYEGGSDGGGGGSTDLGVAEIEGRIFKPAVFFVLARSDFQYQAIEFKQSFVDRILAGALKRPF